MIIFFSDYRRKYQFLRKYKIIKKMLRNKKIQYSLDVSKINSSILTTETTAENMEREIDNYTRRLQQDKRKFFRAQENYSEIKKQFDNKNKQLEKLKSKKHKTELITLKAKISTLEGSLDQIINSYNQALAKNNRLKSQIDQLRKDKKTQNEKIKYLNDQINTVVIQIEQKKFLIDNKKSNIQKIKQEIIKYRELNENEVRSYENEVSELKKSFVTSGRENEKKKKDEKNVKTDNMDTQPIVKLRLRNLILQNKEKIKIIQQYKKNMHLIYENFQQIKQDSGIQTLEEITKTFLKHQEQKGFIYQYISRLNTTIEELRQGNQEIRKKISKQEESNQERRLMFSGTPEEQKRKRDLENFKQSKEKKINEMNSFLTDIKPKLVQVFKAYGVIGESEDFELTPNNIESYLAQIQNLLNNCANESSAVCKADFKQDVTKYTKLPPSVYDEAVSAKTEEKLIERQKLKDLANEFWERKKVNRMVSSKGTELRNQNCNNEQ